MGLSKDSMGLKAVDSGLIIKKTHDTDKVVALGGNPKLIRYDNAVIPMDKEFHGF